MSEPASKPLSYREQAGTAAHPLAGLPDVVAPIPIDLPRAGLARGARRLVQIAMLGARHMPPVAMRKLIRRPGGAAVAGRRLFDGLGATYVKFGQFIASAPGLVGEELAEEFRGCLDAGPAVPFAKVRTIVESEIGAPIASVFTSFDEKPIAAASIAVVHRATLLDGAEVAVKVLRPGIERTIATDLGMMEGWVRFMAARGIDQMYNMVALIVGLRAQIAEELDLRNEARTMDTFRDLFERFGLKRLVIPRVYHQHTRRRVLTMELLDGRPIDDLAHATALGVDVAALVRELLDAWVLAGLRVRAFHADIHAGNLFVLRDGRLGMLDWGILSRFDDDSDAIFRHMCEASLGRDEAWDEIAKYMIKSNGPSFYALGLDDAQIRNFVRASFEPVLTQPLSEVSMAALLATGDDVTTRATGEPPPKRDRWYRIRAMRSAAKAYRAAVASRAFETSTMRMGFLSIKQLVYLERYGRMYIPDELLLGDPEFVRRALSDAPDTARAP
jgi:predicted unusual protein kinase regulating ubiquinone biosynthesis (AarF/ABC1/UbiB family)